MSYKFHGDQPVAPRLIRNQTKRSGWPAAGVTIGPPSIGGYPPIQTNRRRGIPRPQKPGTCVVTYGRATPRNNVHLIRIHTRPILSRFDAFEKEQRATGPAWLKRRLPTVKSVFVVFRSLSLSLSSHEITDFANEDCFPPCSVFLRVTRLFETLYSSRARSFAMILVSTFRTSYILLFTIFAISLLRRNVTSFHSFMFLYLPFY